MPNKPKQKQKPKEEASLLNVKKAASFLGVSTSTIRQWALAKKLKAQKVGSRGDWRFTKEELSKMLWVEDKKSPKGNTFLKKHDIGGIHIKSTSVEEDLRLSKAQLQVLLDKTPMGVYLIDADFRIREVNPTALSVFGAIPDLIGRNFDEVIHQLWSKEYADEVARLFRHTLETGEPYYTPERIEERRDLGVTEYYEWQINRIPLPDGRDGVVCYFRDISTQVLARLAMAKSEEKYRTLFNTIDQGFIIVEVVQDAAGSVIDFRYQEVNSAYEQQTGLQNVAGKLASEITPHLESYRLEPFEHVVKTGEPTRIENYNEDTRKWYQAHYSRVGGVGSRLICVVFDEITERKRHEANLAFLADMNDELVRMTNIDETVHALCEKIGKHFSATTTTFLEIDEDAGTCDVLQIWNHSGKGIIPTGVFSLADFHSEETQKQLHIGNPQIVCDTTSFPKAIADNMASLNIGAYVNFPLVRNGKWCLLLSIVVSKPRDWRADEINLMTDLVARIWTRIERARAEIALGETQNTLRIVLEAAELGTYVWHAEEDRTEPDARMLELYGMQEHEAMTFANVSARVIHQEDLPAYVDAITKALSPDGDGRLTLDFRIFHPDGSMHWLGASGYTTFSESPRKALRIYGTAANIDERKRHEANFVFLADVSADLVSLTNIDGAMNALGAKIGAHFGASICSFLKIDADRGIGTVTHCWHAEDAVNLIGEYQIADYGTEEQLATWNSGNPFVVKDAKTDKRVNGGALAQYGIGSYLSVPIARDGQWRYLLSIYDRVARDWTADEIELMRELTSRIWTRLERARAEESLQKAALQKDEFIGVAAHELKTPVTSVKAYTQVLEHRFRKGGDAASADMVQKITIQVDKLDNLISDLLDVTKIESGKLEFKKEYFDMNRLVEEVVEEMQQTSTKHRFKLALIKNKPVFADRDRIGQVLINLLTNAIKYSHSKKEMLISTIVEDQNVIVSVQDFGIGIPKEQQQKIFERFHRVSGRRKETYPGLGLGLYISSEIIKRHNGRMWVQSAVKKGSTFYVSLPKAKKK